jgi:HK97 gp10 family phage protein
MQMSFRVSGLKELNAKLKAIDDEIGDKKTNSKIVIPAMREAMQPVLQMAQANAPVDTGGLRLSLQVEARRPTRADRRSKYVSPYDSVIAIVTTASGRKLARMSEGAGLKQSKKRLGAMTQDAHYGAYLSNKFAGVKSDARAIAQEFGTAHNGAKPFLRSAIEAQQTSTVNTLAAILRRRLTNYTNTK